jgi:hypothetical protein
MSIKKLSDSHEPRRAFRNESPRYPISFITGDTEHMVTEESGAELMHALDLALHPWGKPGAIPTVPGAYSWQWRYDDDTWLDESPVIIYTAEVTGGLALDHLGGTYRPADLANLRGSKNVRFRKRWTPEAP